MKGGNKLFLFAGVGLAIVAILLGITMSGGGGGNDNETDAAQQEAADPGKITVVKLLQDIEAHTVIKAEMVETVEVDANVAPTDAVTVAADVVGQSYSLKASVGEILKAQFVTPPGIAASIEPGMRAVSLAVDAQGSMSGLVVTGDYIDVVFEARVNIRRILDMGGAEDGLEVEEDGPYQLSDLPVDSGLDQVWQGKDGGEFTASDGGDMLEPAVKMLVQDVKVIRVIAPGERYDAQGQPVAAPEEGAPTAEEMGQLIIQVTPQQAEAIAFMQSDLHTYSIAVRGTDDHSIAQTSGITFEILMSDGTWSLPWPEPIVAEDAREQRGASGTPVAEAGGDEDDEDNP